jgi:hypothetical protein
MVENIWFHLTNHYFKPKYKFIAWPLHDLKDRTDRKHIYVVVSAHDEARFHRRPIVFILGRLSGKDIDASTEEQGELVGRYFESLSQGPDAHHVPNLRKLYGVISSGVNFKFFTYHRVDGEDGTRTWVPRQFAVPRRTGGGTGRMDPYAAVNIAEDLISIHEMILVITRLAFND